MSSDEADDERESRGQTPIVECVDPKTLRFTLFVVLPDDKVCTLRDLLNGITVLDLKVRLEIYAGIPAQLYSLVYPDGETLEDDQKLIVQENVLHGYILKIHLHEKWASLFNAIGRNNIEEVYHSGGVHLKGNISISVEEADKYESVIKERGKVALYMASHLGLHRMVNMLVSVGVNTKSTTIFGRTALHGAVAKDQVVVVNLLLSKGALANQADCFGLLPIDIAKSLNASLCFRTLRRIQLNIHYSSDKVPNKSILRNRPNTSAVSASFDRAYSTLSQGSEAVPSPKQCWQTEAQTHTSRKHMSSSAPAAEGSMRNQQADASDSGISSASTTTTGKIRHKHKVKWKDSPRHAPKEFTQLVELPGNMQVAVNVKQVSYALPKTIMKFSEVNAQNVADNHDNKRASVATDDDTTTDISSRQSQTISPHLKQAMKYSKSKLKYYRTLAKPTDEYVPMANRPRSYTRATTSEDSPAFKEWLRKKAAEKEVKEEIEEEELEELNSELSAVELLHLHDDSDEDEMFEFNKRVRKMNRENARRAITSANKPVMNLMEFGSTVVGECNNPPSEGNIKAYREWLSKRNGVSGGNNTSREKSGQVKQRGAQRPNTHRGENKSNVQKGTSTTNQVDQGGDGFSVHRPDMNHNAHNAQRPNTRLSAEDLLAQKRMLEERRKKLLMSAVTYEEWMDFTEENQAVIRHIMKAEAAERKQRENTPDEYRSRMFNYELWKEKLHKREEDERRRRQIQKRYENRRIQEKLELARSARAVPFDEWLQKKKVPV